MVHGVRRAVGRWRAVLRWRTFLSDDTAVQNLETLADALRPKGWRCVGLYERHEFRYPAPLLWVYASGAADDVGAMVTVRATPGGTWSYFEAGAGRGWYLSSCRDAEVAADRLDQLLKYRMYPNTEWT